MLDFVRIRTSTKTTNKSGARESVITVYPEFIVGPSEDLMIRGGAFYAVWDEASGYWSKDPSCVAKAVDEAMAEKRDEFPEEVNIDVRWMRSYSTKKWDEFLSYCRSLPDNFHELDSSVVFLDDDIGKSDYATKRLPYPLKPGKHDAYDELVGTLYEPIERQKLEWAIGAIISGDSKKIQKFIVLYGSAGSGKSTFLSIVQMLFPGYYNVFEAKALTSSGNSFALEMFRDNPLVSIQHDGDLSRIEDNTKLNSIVSHEEMVVNEKRKSQYVTYFRTFLFMGTNKPVKITDVKSGITRRLIDVKPSGDTVPFDRYQVLMAQIGFELGAIASHCLKVYLKLGMSAYDRYRPMEMFGATNDFYNFVEDNYDIFKQESGTTLAQAWTLYKRWAEDAAVKYPMSKRAIKEELKGYFKEYSERARLGDGTFSRSVYRGFLSDKFSYSVDSSHSTPVSSAITLDLRSDLGSIFDQTYSDAPAQLASENGTPLLKWERVKTTLSDIDTRKLHFVKLPINHIVIDFDLKDDEGNKDLEANLRAASKWPSTYTELSRSGNGVHLHYIYDGNVEELSPLYAENIEVKTFKGNSALRRKLTRCNNLPISVLSSGLPLKKGANMLDFEGLNDEKHLRALIEKNLRKEIHPGTKPSVDFIYKILNDAYNSGMHYDVTDMRQNITVFANNSTHHSLYCMKLVNNMKFHSEEPSEDISWIADELVFYDVEVFPNLFVVVWKREGEENEPHIMINPEPSDIELLTKMKLVGFNNRRYDNHILYARLLGFSNEDLYHLSQKMINGSANAMFREAYNLAFADIYDFSSKKQSLKKWEIELDIHHQELGLPWDEPVPENLWEKVGSYCVNDVIATEATFKACFSDFQARELLADLSGLSVANTTRQHATRIIFGKDKNPQSKFVYTDLSEMFPGYVYDAGKSTYRGEEVGEGGYVYSEPGMYENVALLDIASMHPNSLIQLNLFGDEYTKNFKDLLDARIAIKHKDYESASKMLGGKLKPYLGSPEDSDKLAYALKIIINSVYGLTAAKFECEFKDPRNVDNIVAKRGALFMIDLKHAVQEKGFTVAHIKTDSIKIPEATPDIIDFVVEFGARYGYSFELEATYDRFCLVNDAVYICRDRANVWHATGAQFAVPYVFKSLFSGEPLTFKDFCEARAVTGSSSLFLDMNEGLGEGEHSYHFVGRAGSFCPILEGRGGGILLREKDGKYYAVTGTKGYRWLESEVVKNLEKSDDINVGYFDRLADEAKKAIEVYGSFEKFVSKGE